MSTAQPSGDSQTISKLSCKHCV